MASSESPKASAIPRKPIFPPANTALPTPPNTNTKVPRDSAKYLFTLNSYGTSKCGIFTVYARGRRLMCTVMPNGKLEGDTSVGCGTPGFVPVQRSRHVVSLTLNFNDRGMRWD